VSAEKPRLPAVGGRPQAIIPTDIDAVYRMSEGISRSGLAPADLNTPDKIMVAIMTGMEIGLPPMASLQCIAVIKGRPTIWGDAGLALCLDSVVCEDVDEFFEGEPGTDGFKAVCVAKRRGKEKVIRREFSVFDAKKAGLWDEREKVRARDGTEKRNDSPWFRFAKRMLQMRARGFCLRDAFPDVLRGLHLREEMDDGHVIEHDNAPRASAADAPEPPAQIENKPEAPMSILGTARNEALEATGVLVRRDSDGAMFVQDQKTGELKPAGEAMASGQTITVKGHGAADPAAMKIMNKEHAEQVREAIKDVVAPLMVDDDDDMPPEPPPAGPKLKKVPDWPLAAYARTHEIALAMSNYEEAARQAKDTDALDNAWAQHISPVENKMPREDYEKCASIDDHFRAKMEIYGEEEARPSGR